jgi:mannosyltransferase
MISAARHTGATQLAYYLLLHVWMAAFGIPPTRCGRCPCGPWRPRPPCVALVGGWLAGRGLGPLLIAGVVFALVPSVSRFAQEGLHALAVLVAALATLLLLRALDRPSASRWIAYGASLALLGYVDLVALSVVAGHVAGAVLRSWYHGDRRLLWFPPRRGGRAGGLPAGGPGGLRAGRAPGRVDSAARPRPDRLASLRPEPVLLHLVATALIILAVLAWAVAWREAAFMTAPAIGPVAAVWLASQGTYCTLPRYLLFTVGPGLCWPGSG